MTTKSAFYICTHQPLPWSLPFAHRVIGVEGYTPDSADGLPAAQIISRALDFETAFGAMRSMMAINSELDSLDESTQVFLGTYRLFLGKEMSHDWLSADMSDHRIVSPQDLHSGWQDIVSTEIPPGIDILIPAPILLPESMVSHYAVSHHLDDLLLAVGCAIRAGLLEPRTVSAMLTSNTLIPYGNFAARRELRYDFNRRLWSCALDFYKNHYIPRSGYQRRVIDFAFERVTSMAIVQMIMREKLRCLSCRSISISVDGQYRRSP